MHAVHAAPVRLQGWHKVLFDDGDRVEYKLEDETWRLATPEDEAEAAAQSGAVAFPPAHGPPLHTPSAPGVATRLCRQFGGACSQQCVTQPQGMQLLPWMSACIRHGGALGNAILLGETA